MDDDAKKIMDIISRLETRTLIVMAGSIMVEVNNRIVQEQCVIQEKR